MSKKVTFSITISQELNDWLKKQANNLGISKNAQIIFFLEQRRKAEGIVKYYLDNDGKYKPL